MLLLDAWVGRTEFFLLHWEWGGLLEGAALSREAVARKKF
jgi:hypothetical protein